MIKLEDSYWLIEPSSRAVNLDDSTLSCCQGNYVLAQSIYCRDNKTLVMTTELPRQLNASSDLIVDAAIKWRCGLNSVAATVRRSRAKALCHKGRHCRDNKIMPRHERSCDNQMYHQALYCHGSSLVRAPLRLSRQRALHPTK